jgi:putative SOS response-associated peptidase YedK
MCGRYNVLPDVEAWVTAFSILGEELAGLDITHRYNVAPAEKRKTKEDLIRWIPVIRQDEQHRTVEMAVWSLIPKWCKGILPDWSTANARSETAAKLNTFKGPWNHSQRCLIPANGFYEWQKQASGPKQPYHIGMRDQSVFAFGGLWDVSINAEGEAVESSTILTTTPNAVMKPIHNRMPVIVPRSEYSTWLSGTPEQAEELCVPFPAELLQAYKISRMLNNPGLDDERIIHPSDEEVE